MKSTLTTMMVNFLLSNLRSFLLGLAFVIPFFAEVNAQCKEFMIGVNGDTLNCIDMTSKKKGKWVNRYEELRGEPGYEEEGEYQNDQKTGIWRLYSLQGDVLGIENYRAGNKHGQQQYFSPNGNLIREEGWLASNPENPYETVEVYDINNPGKVQLVKVKIDASTVPHGIWKVFDPESGILLEKKNFILGKEDDGTGTANGIIKKEDQPTTTTETKEPEKKEKPKPKEVLEFEKTKEGKKKYKVRTGETG
jgi:hypothetical protein